MNLQFFYYNDDTTLLYETDIITSAKREPDIQNVVSFDTLGGNKVIQKIRMPIDSYTFTLEGISSDTFQQFYYNLSASNYGVKVLYPKSNFGLESKRSGFVTIVSIDDEKYKHQDLEVEGRLIDVTLKFTPFSWYY